MYKYAAFALFFLVSSGNANAAGDCNADQLQLTNERLNKTLQNKEQEIKSLKRWSANLKRQLDPCEKRRNDLSMQLKQCVSRNNTAPSPNNRMEHPSTNISANNNVTEKLRCNKLTEEFNETTHLQSKLDNETQLRIQAENEAATLTGDVAMLKSELNVCKQNSNDLQAQIAVLKQTPTTLPTQPKICRNQENTKDQRHGGPPTSLFPKPTEAMLKEADRKYAYAPSDELCDPSGSWWWVLTKGRVFDINTGFYLPGNSVLDEFIKLKRGKYGWIGWPDVILPAGLGGFKMTVSIGKRKHQKAVQVNFAVAADDYNTRIAQVRFPLKLRVELRFFSPESKKLIGGVLTEVITLTEVSYTDPDSLLLVPDTVLSYSSQPPVIHVTFSSP